MLDEIGRVVEQNIADAAAQDDAERHPQDEVIIVGDGERRLSAPQRLRAHDRARIEPAAQDTHDIGERIPADGERPDADEHRVDVGEGYDVWGAWGCGLWSSSGWQEGR